MAKAAVAGARVARGRGDFTAAQLVAGGRPGKERVARLRAELRLGAGGAAPPTRMRMKNEGGTCAEDVQRRNEATYPFTSR